MFTKSALVALLIVAAPTKADELDILKEETFRVIVGASAGGTTDTIARTFVRFLKDVLPESTFRIQNVRGSGGAKAVKELQEAEGSLTTFAVINNGPIYAQIASPEAAPYDLNRVHWIGSVMGVERVLAMPSG